MPGNRHAPRGARTGYVILAALLGGAALVFNLDTLVQVTRGHIDVVAIVPNAEGVRPGSSVWVAGVESGSVTRVAFLGPTDAEAVPDGDAAVAVHMRVEPRSREVVTASSEVRVSRLRFIGEPVVRIGRGDPDDAPLTDGDTLRGPAPVDPAALLERVTALPEGLDSLRVALAVLEKRARERRPRIRRLTADLATLSDMAGRLSADLDRGSLGRLLDPDGGLGGRLAAIQGDFERIRAAADTLHARYGVAGFAPDGGESGELAAATDRLLERVAVTRAELDRLRARMEAGHGFLVRSAEDTAIQVAIRGVQAQIDSLSAEAMSIGLRMLLP